jgi:hypothetical protein
MFLLATLNVKDAWLNVEKLKDRDERILKAEVTAD